VLPQRQEQRLNLLRWCDKCQFKHFKGINMKVPDIALITFLNSVVSSLVEVSSVAHLVDASKLTVSNSKEDVSIKFNKSALICSKFRFKTFSVGEI
jgi:hypothetical protein